MKITKATKEEIRNVYSPIFNLEEHKNKLKRFFDEN